MTTDKMPAKRRPETPQERGARQLQEVYSALDRSGGGTIRIAWYGQLRAQEIGHTDALHQTLVHFGLA